MFSRKKLKGLFSILLYSIIIIAFIFSFIPTGFIFAEGPATAALTIKPPLTELKEDNLNGAVLTITLTDDTFVDNLIDTNNIVLNNAPTGLTVGSITWVDTINIEVNLVFDGTDFDSDISDFSVTINAAELQGGSNLTTDTVAIIATIETASCYIAFVGSTYPDSDTCINLDLRDAEAGDLLWKLTISDGTDIIKTLIGTGSAGTDSNGFTDIGPLAAGTYTATLKLFETEQARDADTPYIAMDTRIFEIWEHTSSIAVSQGASPDNVVFNMAVTNSNGKYWFIGLDRVNPENPNDITYIGKYCPSNFPGAPPTIDSNDWTLDVATGLEEGTYRATIWIGLNSNEGDGNPENNEVVFTIDANGNVSIVNIPPVAQASIDPNEAPVSTVFTFDGSASYDEDGTIGSYDWDFADGGNGSGGTTTHVYTSAGTYTVTLTVTDNDGATDTATAIATVQTPEEATQDLITDIEELNLPGGIENSLTSKLEAAIKSLNKGQENAAINKLNAFINQVEAQRGKKITDEQADELIAGAQRIINNI